MKKVSEISTKKRIIVNADDFGMNEAASRGILLAAQRGWVNSMSVCVTIPQASHPLRSSLEPLADVSIGLHVNLTE
jgi:predicted glycoside hydrolase/deacetylase ChbG (UPF0249 family)